MCYKPDKSKSYRHHRVGRHTVGRTLGQANRLFAPILFMVETPRRDRGVATYAG